MIAKVGVEGTIAMGNGTETSKTALEPIKITVGHKDPDALTRLLIKQREELLGAADSVEYIPHFPME
jgi:hypothetical protein